MTAIWKKKYFHKNNIILHQIFEDGSHEVVVDGESGGRKSYEEISLNNNYMGFTDYLSPDGNPMVVHLEYGKLQEY